MKLKKLLCSFLAIAMLLSTMGTVAFAEGADVWDGTVDTSWYNETDTEFTITTAEQWAGLAYLVNGAQSFNPALDNDDTADFGYYAGEPDGKKSAKPDETAAENSISFKGKTIYLAVDLDLCPVDADGNLVKLPGNEQLSMMPVGYSKYTPFKGTFDGQRHTIKNLFQGGWDLYGLNYSGVYLGLFGVVEDATIKNLVVDNFAFNCEINLGTIAGLSGGQSTFDNITVKNSTVDNSGGWWVGGLIGWAYGNQTIKNISIDETNTIAQDGGHYDTAVGGIIGGCNNVDGESIAFINCDVACKLDVYNDCTANYNTGVYRNCGMVIGGIGEDNESLIDGKKYPDFDAKGLTFENVNVTIGEWANYTYCWSYDLPKNCQRIEPGVGYAGVDVSTVTDPSIDTSKPFDAIFGAENAGDLSNVRGPVNLEVMKFLGIEGVSLYNQAQEAISSASIGEGNDIEYFETLQDAVDIAVAGDTVLMLRDTAENIGLGILGGISLLAVEDAIIFDLGGYTLSPENADYPTVTNGGDYIIQNGTLAGDIECSDGNLEMQDVTVEGDVIVSGGAAKITSGTYHGGITVSDDASLVVYGGQFASKFNRKYLAPGLVFVKNDNDYYDVVANENLVTITFDFDGGVNAKGESEETFVLALGEAINAPSGLKKEDFIFKGWDKQVPSNAYASETYTAVWVAEADYGFETVLTPIGGTKLSENEIKVDPNGSFLIEVSVANLHGDEPWNVAEITLDYDNTLFKWNPIGTSVEEVDDNTLRFKIYGADRVDGKAVKQLSFTALNPADPKTYTGAFTVAEATVDTGWAANTIDATPAEEGTAIVYIYYTFNVTLGEGLEGPSTAATDTNYVGEIDKNIFDNNYIYEFTGKSGNNDLVITYDDEGNFTVTKDQIVGDMTINVKKIGVKGIEEADVEIYEYVAGKYALVLLNADNSRVYTYNGSLMYETPWYDTVAGSKIHYGYLVKEPGFVADSEGSLNTQANKALAMANLGLSYTESSNIQIENNAGDVNNTTMIDVNDIQAVWNCYNVDGNDGAGINVNMPLYLRADICGAGASNRDKKVNVADLNAVLAMYDCINGGGAPVFTEPVLATCDTDGNTYAIVCNGTVIVESEVIPALGHNYVSTGFIVENGEMLNVLNCDKCGGENKEAISEIVTFVGDITSLGKLKGTMSIDSAEGLMLYNELVQAGKIHYGEGQEFVVNITDDIDLAGYEWTALTIMFTTFNGNGHTIYNINAVEANDGVGRGGFLGYGGACQINDLTLENVTVEGSQVGAFVGAGEGTTVSNCTLKGNVNITWKQNYTSNYVESAGAIGIIAGLNANGGNYTVTIDANTNITLAGENERTTALDDSSSWFTTCRPWIQFTLNEQTICNVTDNR